MKPPSTTEPGRRRSRAAAVRAAVARSREARPRAIERRLLAALTYLHRHDRPAHDQLVASLRRVLSRQARKARR